MNVFEIPNIIDFDLQNSDKFAVIHINGKEEIFNNVTIEQVAIDLKFDGVKQIKDIFAI